MNWTHVFLETPLGKEKQMLSMSCGSPRGTRQRLGLSHGSPPALEPPVAAAWEPCAATALLLVAACNQPWHQQGLLELPRRSFSWLSPQELLQHLHKKLVHVLAVCKWVRVAEELEKTLLGLSHKGLLLWAADPMIGKAWSFILETVQTPERSSAPFVSSLSFELLVTGSERNGWLQMFPKLWFISCCISTIRMRPHPSTFTQASSPSLHVWVYREAPGPAPAQRNLRASPCTALEGLPLTFGAGPAPWLAPSSMAVVGEEFQQNITATQKGS